MSADSLDSSWVSFVKWSSTPKAKSSRRINIVQNNESASAQVRNVIAGMGSPIVKMELNRTTTTNKGEEVDLDSFLDVDSDGGWGEERCCTTV